MDFCCRVRNEDLIVRLGEYDVRYVLVCGRLLLNLNRPKNNEKKFSYKTSGSTFSRTPEMFLDPYLDRAQGLNKGAHLHKKMINGAQPARTSHSP